MPLVFVHGVANRPSLEQTEAIAQRDALFRAIVFRSADTVIKNPDWGSHAAAFDVKMPWLPKPTGNQAFGVANASGEVGLGRIAKVDGIQAVDLAAYAALEKALRDGQAKPGAATNTNLISLVTEIADYLEPAVLAQGKGQPKGIPALVATKDDEFADALQGELQLKKAGTAQAFGIKDRIKEAVDELGGWIGNAASDAVLRAKRADLSKSVTYFLGDIFVYLKQRDVVGVQGVRDRIFEPILKDLIAAANVKKNENEPLVVIGHSLGGVLLYDILTDDQCLKRLSDEAPKFKIDALLTVGSQPGFFADLKLYGDRGAALLPRPKSVSRWMNVYDFTDVFSFLCEPVFADVEDFGYDTSVDLLHAHSAYFQKPSFYKRLQLRLKEQGFQ
ncbi:hypothetical protein ACNJYD_10080 [Bradyrhizobium sp. DASA03005]|uniref:hypothetical protein n=1 Tax=Bradyrhizobium sp. SPXBL-02 TaxID=3395912 RepID=UPI003F6E973C